MRVLQGNLIGEGQRVALVASRFNELITNKLIEGAKDILFRHGVRPQDVDLYWVPGAWELPLIAEELALSGDYDAVIPLGAIIRGDTPHFDYVASEVSKGLAKIALEQRVPVVFGVLTCDNLEQALLRAGSKAGNKGAEAAMAALEMVNLLSQIRNQKGGTQIA
ncbi:MAG: 6,7-dimethyl-8-ribityllumazine synthase [Acetomicrobium sp.]|jgi:6,7-dimethyl-8-ribityllumazine synthase|uniref:6,7-dimethyl-8-ribityllumazine synthase n=2 Tax=Acetomicrobium TaxID=49894 RepID=A0A0T5XCR7_9BACT|nr:MULTISPECIES: 6,7-dimethyl-8-ribityllumazine synthase [Acetomicrobium]KRT36157.1 6,7-dimethyl-8-ribityllumazine synthase [Acetomicrobium hydrogeniformans ATCC BAA-1850]MBC7322018.1 6,7-dimethyl-8-ribityllumazine synthase [Acetomicrobium sp.]SDY03894.1 6,7-dimethyl-8-ribityllumazine synthase [Acetomicrobium thermoterrenum DSM 13490]